MLATGPNPSPTEGTPHGGEAPGSRPLSSLAAISIAGLTAAIVIGAGVFVAERGDMARRATSDAIAPIPAAAAPPATAQGERSQGSSAAPSAVSAAPSAASATLPAVSAAPTVAPETARAAAAPAVSSKPDAPPRGAPLSPSASAIAPLLPPASLPPQLGYLAVRRHSDAHVYVNGVDIGPTNHALETLCGLRYVRVGSASIGGKPPAWFGPGQSVKIVCRALTEVTAPAVP